MAMLQSTFILCFLIGSSVSLSPKKKPVESPPSPPPTPCCNKNEHYVRDSNACEKACANRDYLHLAGACKPISKCVCNGDLMRLNDDATGPCVTEDQCSPPCPDGDKNAIAQECPSWCQPTCDQPIPNEICPAACFPRGCVCKPGFILESRNGKCIAKEDCNRGDEPCTGSSASASAKSYSRSERSSSSSFSSSKSHKSSSSSSSSTKTKTGSKGCNGDINAEHTDCTSRCPPTCEPSDMACPAVCGPPGCQCKSGYVLSDGKCILPEECPENFLIQEAVIHCHDGNATYSKCPSLCPLTCEEPDPVPCFKMCGPEGCVCKEGYVLSSDRGCILPQDCSANPTCEDTNAEYQHCPSACQPTCEVPDENIPCIRMCAPAGCVCKPGYLLSDGKCVLPRHCPARPICNEDGNTTYEVCPSMCQPTCEQPDENVPCVQMCAPDGCVCKRGYVLLHGKCVLPQDCPDSRTPRCYDRNAEYQECPSLCQPTCEAPNENVACVMMCAPAGCVCKQGYVLSDGMCVRPHECPATMTCKDRNKEYQECPSLCQPTCEAPNENVACVMMCAPAGCVCKQGYVLSDGMCVRPHECPASMTCKDRNKEYQECPSLCQPTCEAPNENVACVMMCAPAGCVCKQGYVLSDGMCVRPHECPASMTCKDRNKEYQECPSMCQPTCAEPDTNVPCVHMCAPSGCVCKPGLVLSPLGGCVLPHECPVIWNIDEDDDCRGNTTYQECPSLCQPTCDLPRISICSKKCAPDGCVCKPGYVLYNNKCILLKDCPGCNGDKNATLTSCTSRCPPTCEPTGMMCAAVCGPPGCQCKPDYVLSGGKCILPQDCPEPSSCNGDRNATYQTCPSMCQRTCEQQELPEACVLMCAPDGCVCNDGYVLSSDGKCVLPQDCPVTEPPSCKCGSNSTFQECPSMCPPTCEQPHPEACILMCAPDGCVCDDGYVLSSDGRCILLQDCPEPPSCKCGSNSTFQECPSMCPPTCEQPHPEACILMCASDGCVCDDGYVLSSDGRCILLQDCPEPPSCECGSNATYQTCPSVCQPTCEKPELPEACVLMCAPDGCVCNDGYVLSSDGRCILPQDCPKPPSCKCGSNATYQECPSMCQPTCEQQQPAVACVAMCAPDGCVCNNGYVLSSEGKCILPQDCPRPGCNENATYQECPSMCQPSCDQPNQYVPCVDACAPAGCVCNQGYLKSGDKCILPKDCLAAQCSIPEQCRPTCTFPNPPNCPYQPPASVNKDGCECQAGFILSGVGGPCIRIEECPQDQSCNGDPHARVMSCPWSCPATCDSPNASQCKKCVPVGCTCKSGYLQSSENGSCILAGDCPCGNPCGPNGTFVDCGFRCPNQNCPKDDSRVQIACKPGRPCPPGCACNDNYKRLSYENDICIKASDCPPVECTSRPHEIWDSSATVCLAEGCSNVYDPPTSCDTLDPKCVCEKGYFRNSSDICVPAKECNTPNPCNSDCASTCANPNPPNCTYNPDEKRCCEQGYVQLGKGDKCVRIEDCPTGNGCNGDPNAVVKQCPQACPSTCDNPESVPCRRACLEVGCQCASGYILSVDGKCISPDKCPGGNPCGKNAKFVGCKSYCPTDYCAVDDSRGIMICETYPLAACYSGCVCDYGFIKNNREENKCIRPSCCAPVNCTRQNERYDSCPSPCLAEGCQDVNNQPTTCNTLVEAICRPRCVCIKGTFRNSSELCVPAAECDVVA